MAAAKQSSYLPHSRILLSRFIIILISCLHLNYIHCASELEVPTLFVNLNAANPYRWNQPKPPEENITLVRLGVNSDYSFSGETDYAVIICNATYPITWVFHNTEQSGHAVWMIDIKMRRIVSILYDPTTYVYTAELGLYGDYNRLTGNYSCMSTTKSSLHNSVYVYWEGSSPSSSVVYLTQAGENRSVCANDEVTKLPCQVSKPNVKPTLLKETSAGLQILNLNKSIMFNPKDGYILKALPDLIGNYKCVSDADYSSSKSYDRAYLAPGSEDDQHLKEVNIKVEKCNDTIPIDPKKSNATIKYDPKKRELVCCSSTARAPKMFHFYCHHPIMCSFRQELDSSYLRHYFGMKRSRKGCSRYKLYIFSPGVVRCIGDGIDSTVEYTYPFITDYAFGMNTSHIPIYLSWNEIPPADMMVIQPDLPYYMRWNSNQNEFDKNIYEGQTATFYCHTSAYYFARGNHWAVKYKNNTLKFINDTIRDGLGYGYYNSNMEALNLVIHSDMESVICIAPVWNTTEYVHKPFHLYVNDSIAPELIHTEEETLTWVLNDTDKIIKCEAKGTPAPLVRWSHTDPNQVTTFVHFINTSYVDELNNDTYIVSETIKIPRVTHSTQGDYNCSASNYGGHVYKVVHVIVEEPISWKTQTAIIVGVVLGIVLVFGIIFLGWRTFVEKKVVQQLSVSANINQGQDSSIVERRSSNANVSITPISVAVNNLGIDIGYIPGETNDDNNDGHDDADGIATMNSNQNENGHFYNNHLI